MDRFDEAMAFYIKDEEYRKVYLGLVDKRVVASPHPEGCG